MFCICTPWQIYKCVMNKFYNSKNIRNCCEMVYLNHNSYVKFLYRLFVKIGIPMFRNI